jgi:hypothetical protein
MAPASEQESALEALHETIAHRTVAIVPEESLECGSGVCIRYAQEYFVVTAAHLVERRPLNDILFIAPPDAPLVMTWPPTAFSERFLPPIVDVAVSPNSMDDLALLRLKSRPREMRHLEFYEPTLPEPPRLLRKQVILHGFPVESIRVHHTRQEAVGGVFPYFDYPSITRVSARESAALRRAKHPYRPLLHVLLRFPAVPPDSPLLKHPGGLSGAGLWKGPRKPANSALWLPTKARLVGIQVGWSEKRELLIATRSSRVWRLFEHWARTRRS